MQIRDQHQEVLHLLQHLRSRDLSAVEWESLHALAAEDAFLLDAIEGLRQIPAGQRTAHLQSLQKALAEKYARHKPVPHFTLYLRAAASILLVIGVFWIVNEYLLKDRQQLIAEEISLQNEPVDADDAMGYADSMPITEADQETRPGSSEDPQMQPLSAIRPTQQRNEGSKEIAANDSGSKATVDGISDHPDRDETTAEPSARTAAPALSGVSESEFLSKEDSGVAFLVPEVKGIVMNRSGEPIIGAQVSVKGTSTQTETDLMGNFALSIPNQNYRNALVISHDAYPVIEADVADGDSLVVRLQEQASNEKADVTTLTQRRISKQATPGSRSMGRPTSGERAYQKYIRQHLQYPKEAADAGIHGVVVVEFDITDDGSPQNFRIIQSLGYGCDEEAIRVIRDGPKWTKGQVNIGRWEITF